VEDLTPMEAQRTWTSNLTNNESNFVDRSELEEFKICDFTEELNQFLSILSVKPGRM
jgi:hypothetical protein